MHDDSMMGPKGAGNGEVERQTDETGLSSILVIVLDRTQKSPAHLCECFGWSHSPPASFRTLPLQRGIVCGPHPLQHGCFLLRLPNPVSDANNNRPCTRPRMETQSM